MKLLPILVLAVALVESQAKVHHPKQVLVKETGINEKLVLFIEHLKDVLKSGNDSLGIPAMDPLSIDYQELSADSDLFRGTVTLNKLKLSGLSSFEVEKAETSIVGLKLSLRLRWSELKGTVDSYDLKGVALNFFDVYGKGHFKFNLEDLWFSTTVSIRTTPEDKTLFIKEMNTTVALGDLQVSMDGLFNDKDLSDVTSAIASDLGPTVVQTYQKKLTESINKVVITQTNDVLSTMTLKDLLALIQ